MIRLVYWEYRFGIDIVKYNNLVFKFEYYFMVKSGWIIFILYD